MFAVIEPPLQPTRQYGGKLADPARWRLFQPRVGDIVLSSPAKSGSTWMQGILALMISGDPEVDAAVSENAPWLDISVPEAEVVFGRLEAQAHRRQIKTHTPLDGIPVWPELRYISVFRHPIDVHFSFRKHVEHMREEVLAECFPPDISGGFRVFLEGTHRDGASLASIIDHYRSALSFDARENVLRLHYADMRRNLAEAFRRIGAHIGIAHAPDLEAKLIAAAQFDAMKANAGRFAVAAKRGFWRNDADFFDSGTSQKWVGRLTDEDLAAYDARMECLLPREDRVWLEWGGG